MFFEYNSGPFGLLLRASVGYIWFPHFSHILIAVRKRIECESNPPKPNANRNESNHNRIGSRTPKPNANRIRILNLLQAIRAQAAFKIRRDKSTVTRAQFHLATPAIHPLLHATSKRFTAFRTRSRYFTLRHLIQRRTPPTTIRPHWHRYPHATIHATRRHQRRHLYLPADHRARR